MLEYTLLIFVRPTIDFVRQTTMGAVFCAACSLGEELVRSRWSRERLNTNRSFIYLK